MREYCSVAVDGPSGAGKSTLAKALAKRMGFLYVDTGAIYRTLGLAVQRAGLDSKDAAGVVALLPGVEIEMDYAADGTQIMRLHGEDVSREIRTPRSSVYASDISALPEVRAFLIGMQRDMARTHSGGIDGRDIGTGVRPDADVKIFLPASAGARARRRWKELREKGMETDFDEVLRDIEYRDRQDSSRATAPLRAAEDAVVLDNSRLDFEQTVEAAVRIIREKTGR
jgi:cytidylate kinase